MRGQLFRLGVAVSLPIATLICFVTGRMAHYKQRASLVAWQKMNYMQASSPGVVLFQRMGTSAVPALLLALKSPEWYSKRKAAWALGELGSVGSNAVPDLIRALEDKDPGLQMHAMNSLANIGIWRDDIVPGLLDKLNDPTPGIWGCATRLLGVIERERKARNLPPVSEDELEYALAFTRSYVPSIRLIGAHKLAKMPRDERIKEALTLLANDPESWVRQETKMLIDNVGVDEDPFFQFREDPFRQEARRAAASRQPR